MLKKRTTNTPAKKNVKMGRKKTANTPAKTQRNHEYARENHKNAKNMNTPAKLSMKKWQIP